MPLNSPSVLGIDIGGANLKYAAPGAAISGEEGQVDRGMTRSRFFPMWRRYRELGSELARDLKAITQQRAIVSLAVTMTGELADCFLDRAEGVRHIVSQTSQAASVAGIGDVRFYGVDGLFHQPEDAASEPDRIAAANWHALANYVGQVVCRDGVLIDVGSTTTDIVPLADGRIATSAKTDHDRLVEGSLVYIGGGRTPVASLVDEVNHRGLSVSIMNEWFATMDDVRLALNLVRDDPRDCDTADGQPRVIDMAVNRLARMIGLDRRHFHRDDARCLAEQVHRAAQDRIAAATRRIQIASGDPNVFVISGHAPDLIRLPPNVSTMSLIDLLGEEMSRCAPALAVASLCAVTAGEAET